MWPPSLRIKAQQAAFQAAKQTTGNTHTAGGGVTYMISAIVIVTGGLTLASKGMYNMAYGINKYDVPNE